MSHSLLTLFPMPFSYSSVFPPHSIYPLPPCCLAPQPLPCPSWSPRPFSCLLHPFPHSSIPHAFILTSTPQPLPPTSSSFFLLSLLPPPLLLVPHDIPHALILYISHFVLLVSFYPGSLVTHPIPLKMTTPFRSSQTMSTPFRSSQTMFTRLKLCLPPSGRPL